MEKKEKEKDRMGIDQSRNTNVFNVLAEASNNRLRVTACLKRKLLDGDSLNREERRLLKKALKTINKGD